MTVTPRQESPSGFDVFLSEDVETPVGFSSSLPDASGLLYRHGSSGRPRVASFFLTAGFALNWTSGTVTAGALPDTAARFLGRWTSNARTLALLVATPRLPSDQRRSNLEALLPDASEVLSPRPAATTQSGNQAEQVRWVHEASGLTWEQLGRVFGVSRRAVHLWAAGGRMNASNAEMLARLVSLLAELPVGSSEERRTLLLAPGPDGRSVIDRLRSQQLSEDRDASGTPFRPEQLLGARHGDVAERT